MVVMDPLSECHVGNSRNALAAAHFLFSRIFRVLCGIGCFQDERKNMSAVRHR